MNSNFSLEERYITELNKGSYQAFDALYSMYARRVYAFVLKFVKSKSDTNDIVQDVFLKIWTNRDHISLHSSFQSYLFTIAKNRMIDKMRENINSPVFVDYTACLNEQKLSEENNMSVLNYDDFKRNLAKVKKQLSDTQRNVFELVKEQGYSNQEAAGELNLSEQTIRNQLSAALKILKKQMKDFSFLFALFFL